MQRVFTEMTSSFTNGVRGGREDGGSVELVDIRVLPTDEREADGKINEGFHTKDESDEISTVSFPVQQSVNSTSSQQVSGFSH